VTCVPAQDPRAIWINRDLDIKEVEVGDWESEGLLVYLCPGSRSACNMDETGHATGSQHDEAC